MKTEPRTSMWGVFRPKSDSGAVMALIIAGVLPILFVIFAVTIDVASFYARGKQLQRIADEAVLFAERYLPYEDAALQALNATLDSQGLGENVLREFRLNSSLVDLILREDFNIFFGQLFGVTDGVPIAVRAQAVSVPLDVAIVMDIGQSLSPQLPLGTPWGNNLEPASFFEQFPRRFLTVGGIEEDIDPLLSTQQCFNPLFSQVKLASLRIAEFLTHSERNNLSLAFFPGGYAPITMAPYASIGDPPEAPLRFNRYLGTFTSGDLCAATAEMQIFQGLPNYAFPPPSATHATWQPPGGAGPMVEPFLIPHTYDQSYDQSLTLPQAVWAQSTTETGSLVFAEAIAYLEATLLAQQANLARGTLVNRGVKLGFLVLGDLPFDGNGARYPAGSSGLEIDAALQQFSNRAEEAEMLVELAVILIRPANNSLPNYPQDFNPAQLEALRALIQRGGSATEFGLRARLFEIDVGAAGGLNNQLVQYLSRLSQRGVLGR